MERSTADVSQPLLGGQQPDPSDEDNSNRVKPSSSLAFAHIFPRGSTVGDFIGRRLAPWYQRRRQPDNGSDGESHDRGRERDHRDGRDRRDVLHHYDYFYHGYYEEEVFVPRLRSRLRSFLSSRYGHYLVLLLVSVDVACIFADFLIELHTCGLKERHQKVDWGWSMAQEVLSVISLVFSCLFMLELIASVLSFGLGYFSSKFHVFDSLVIVVAFVLDVALRGLVEELGSIVVALRLWRVFKIIEELSAASADAMEKYEDELQDLRRENLSLKRRLRGSGAGTGHGEPDIEADAGGDEGDHHDHDE